MDRFIFIINSRSGSNKNLVLYDRIKSAVKALNLKSQIFTTLHAEDSKRLVQQGLKEGVKYFIAIGGDGTVNTLAKNLVHTDAAIGIIPRGSGNGLARHFHMPRDIQGALARLIKKRIQPIDGIRINDQWSFNVAGIGFDGYISTRFGENGKRGIRNYMKLINQEYKSYDPIEMVIRSESSEFHTPLLQLAIANASQYGNNAIIAPNALLNDQLLDIAMIRKVPLAFLPAFLLKVFSGNIDRSKYFKSFKTSGLVVETSRPVHFHTDGDGKGIADRFEIKVEPNCLKLLY
ncbi:MAG: YegS/Rv2252/BmrU family lipid kinase [Saprospiraceae bacterium]